MKTYTQCKIVKDDAFQVAWIPSEYAIVEKVIKIKVDGLWDDGWMVIDAFGTKSKEHIEGHERDFLKQRKASDI